MVLDGTIDTIASDHSPHSFEKKTPKDGNFWTISEGCTGVQTLLPVMVTEGRKRGLTWTRLVNLCATNPAKRFGLSYKKGDIQVGLDADITLFDPSKEWKQDDNKLFYLNKWSPYSNRTFKGQVVQTIVRGVSVFENGHIQSGPGFWSILQDGYGERINERGIIVKIYVINPNSDANFTRIIYQTAKEFASPGTEIICKSVPDAPSLIEDFADEILCGPGLIKVIKESDLSADAYVLACTCDVNICAIREATTKPVIGIGEISMMAAMTLGYKFSIIQMTRRSVPMKLRMIHSLGFTYRCASVRAMDDSIEGDLIDKITPVALEAVEKTEPKL